MRIWLTILLLGSMLLIGCTIEEPGYFIADPESQVQVVDSDGDIINIDSVTGAITTIEFEHHELHEGDSFVVCDVQNVSSATMKWQVTTPDSTKYAHVIFDLEATGELFILVTEGSDRADGVALEEINRRRVGTPTLATVIVTRTPVGGTTDGTITLFGRRVGSTGQGNKTISGGGNRGINEFILKPNTKYVISATTFANVFVTFCVDWYEHTE